MTTNRQYKLTRQERTKLELLVLPNIPTEKIANDKVRFYNTLSNGSGIYKVGLIDENNKVIYEEEIKYMLPTDKLFY